MDEEAHVAREEPRGKRIEIAEDTPELVIFVGLQASGKSTFFRERFATTHELVSKDLLPNNKNRNRRQAQLIEAPLGAGSSVVVDNTNPTVEDRRSLIELGRGLGARIVGYYFESTVRGCVERNRRRSGKDRVPDVAIFATAKKLIPPSYEEGFDELHRARITDDSTFEVRAETRNRTFRPARESGMLVESSGILERSIRMASTGKELLGEHYEQDHLTYEEIEELNLKAVTEDGRTLAPEELRGKIFRIVDRDEPSGYVVKSMESTGTSTVLCYLQAAS